MEIDTPDQERLEHLEFLRRTPKTDVIRMAISAGRLLEHRDALSDGLETELREFISQVDTMAW